MDQLYAYNFTSYCDNHFIKSFAKKYKTAWLRTEEIIVQSIQHIDMFTKLNRADIISRNANFELVKLDFAIDGKKESPKSSGNRCILHVDNNLKYVEVLLVYSKNDISPPHETVKWQKIVKQEFPEIAKIYSL